MGKGGRCDRYEEAREQCPLILIKACPPGITNYHKLSSLKTSDIYYLTLCESQRGRHGLAEFSPSEFLTRVQLRGWIGLRSHLWLKWRKICFQAYLGVDGI